MQAEKVSLDTSGAEGLLLSGLSIELGLFGGSGDGGGGGGTPQSIGGTTTGLSIGSLTIQNSSGETLVINANGAFSFANPSYNYNVTITNQPSSLRCIVLNGSGTATALVSNIVVTCPMAFQNSLTWHRCSHGQAWDSATGTCTGSAITAQYCNINDGSCHDGIAAGEAGNVNGHLNGNGVSQAFSACNGLNSGGGTFGHTNWRVPWKTELKGLVSCSNGTSTPLADGQNCGTGYSSPTINTVLFPGTRGGAGERYWSASSSYNNYNLVAYSVSFETGNTSDGYNRNVPYFIRCVAN